ncbi:hypothetical protein BgiMline_010929, partial [Biomphalaria glabrata]
MCFNGQVLMVNVFQRTGAYGECVSTDRCVWGMCFNGQVCMGNVFQRTGVYGECVSLV